MPRRLVFEKRTYALIDDINNISCRPDFAILVYPGYLKAKDKNELAPGCGSRPEHPRCSSHTEEQISSALRSTAC